MKRNTNTTLKTRDDIEIKTSTHLGSEKTTIYIHDRNNSDFVWVNRGQVSKSNTSIEEFKVRSGKSRSEAATTQLLMCNNTEETKPKCSKIHGYRTAEDVAKMPACVLNQLSHDKRFERLKKRSEISDITFEQRNKEAGFTNSTRMQEIAKKESDASLFNAEYNFCSKTGQAIISSRSLMDSIRNTVNKFVKKEDLNISTDNSDWDTQSEKQFSLDFDHLPTFPKETKNATIIPIANILTKKATIPCKFCQMKNMETQENCNSSMNEQDLSIKYYKTNDKHGEIEHESKDDNNSNETMEYHLKNDNFETKSLLENGTHKSRTSFTTEDLEDLSNDYERSSSLDEYNDKIFEKDHQKNSPSFKNFEMIPCPRNLLCDQGLHSGRCHQDIRRKLSDPICQNEYCVCRKSDYLNEPDFWLGHNLRIRFPTESSKSSETSMTEDCSGTTSSDVPENVNCSSKVYDNINKPELFFCVGQQDDEDSYDDDRSSSTSSTLIHLFHPNYHRQHRMNGMNGHHHHHHTNGGDNMNGSGGATCGGDIITQNQQKGCWTIGLINSKFRYLTAESFGFKINANGASLKKKQIWTLEPVNNNSSDSLIYLRSHLDKYLAVDSFGNVTCESDEKDPGSNFQISVADDGSGRWALKNVVRGYFLGSSADKLTCTAKVPGDAAFWHVHLAARPQMNLRSVGRKRFAHLSENLDEIHVDANIPWGEDTLFTLEFRLDESGKYAIHTCNNKYLSLGGKLIDQCTKDCLFSAEYHSGQLALRDRAGSYLSPIGSKAVLKTRSNTVTRDELFSLEDSLPQASFVANLNARFVSVKQGVDVTANQDEISDHETFQLEFDWTTKRWYIRTMQDRYWTLETGGGIQASGDKRSSNALFDLAWQQDGSVAFRANNGRYVITKRSGHLYATADNVDDNGKYYFYLINRPILVLKCEQGFVGYKSAASNKLECNKATYECIQVERGEKGVVYFKGQSGKYWHVDSEGVTADSDAQEGFHLELREPTRLCIKSTVGGNYITASKNGLFRLGDSGFESATQWEY